MSDVPARLGLGLAAVGRPAYITTDRDDDLGDAAARSVKAMQARAHALLDEAWRLGIRYIDVARSYGFAERFLGAWLAQHPRRRTALTIGSKWGYEYVGEWRMDAEEHERKEHSLAMFDRQWPETLAALGAAPDLYLVHSVTPDSTALRDEPLLARLRGLAGSGVRVGLSTSGPHQAAVIDDALALADTPFSVVQSTWNLLEGSVAPALARAHDAGWTVVVKEVLANGELARPTPADADGDLRAISAARAQPWADIVLSGASTLAQLRRGAEAVPTDGDALAPAVATVDADEYWRRRSQRPWR